MKKKLVIETCADCPHFDYDYPDGRCELIDLCVKSVDFSVYPIPGDCPLEDAD
jgi:hypothetical protein